MSMTVFKHVYTKHMLPLIKQIGTFIVILLLKPYWSTISLYDRYAIVCVWNNLNIEVSKLVGDFLCIIWDEIQFPT